MKEMKMKKGLTAALAFAAAVAGTVPYLQYNATKGDEPQTVQGGANAAEEPKNGVLGEDMILVVPAQGEKAFFGVKRN